MAGEYANTARRAPNNYTSVFTVASSPVKIVLKMMFARNAKRNNPWLFILMGLNQSQIHI